MTPPCIVDADGNVIVDFELVEEATDATIELFGRLGLNDIEGWFVLKMGVLARESEGDWEDPAVFEFLNSQITDAYEELAQQE